MMLFTPIKLRGIELKNRIVMSAMDLSYLEDGFINERIIRFYEERARGGVGLIILGGCNIDEHSYYFMPSVNHDQYIPGLGEFTHRIKKQGAKVGCQLFQAGRYTYSFLTGIQSVAPSPVASPFTGEVPRELTIDEIYKLIDKFAQAALRAKKAGFDLIEVVASAGYLISQFLSPLTNLRSDEFGGSLENRMRFGLEVIRAVRVQLGDDYPIMVRFAGNELLTGGTAEHEILTFAQELEKAGADALNVTGGWHESKIPQLTMDVPPGAFIYLAQSIKEMVSIPVVASNRINDPVLAEKMLLQGKADLITVARGLIADPEWPRKAKEGRLKEIRKCIACNQGCMDHVFEVKAVECLVNAEAGHEWETEIKPVSDIKRVLVIGGGPAGMEAARVAAQRGHEVYLWEKVGRLGGQLSLAAIPPGRQEFNNLLNFLEESIYRLGVKITLNKEANLTNVTELKPEVIILATGALPISPSIPGIKHNNVVQAWDVLEQGFELGRDIVVIGGGAVGCETALYLANKGTIDAETVRFLLLHNVESPEKIRKLATYSSKKITLIEQKKQIGRDIGKSSRWSILSQLSLHGVNVLTSSSVIAIESNGVLIEKNGVKRGLDADYVVLAVGSKPQDHLYTQLNNLVDEIYLIGDAKEPRKAMEAIREGFQVAILI